jgi:hypothetical protein
MNNNAELIARRPETFPNPNGIVPTSDHFVEHHKVFHRKQRKTGLFRYGKRVQCRHCVTPKLHRLIIRRQPGKLPRLLLQHHGGPMLHLHTLSIKLNHLPPLIPLSRVSNMRSVHTLASVQSHFWGTSLPCLAFGTSGSRHCDCASFTPPPSCPPWLHGHYPLRRYYGDSDSCPAPSSTRTGLLDYRTCISRHSVSIHPMRPRSPAMLLVPGGLDPRFALGRYRRFFGLRSLLAVSSVA